MNDDKIVIITEDGSEKEFNILFSFSLEEFGKDYVAYFAEGEEELYVSSYVPEDEGGKLDNITDENEWDRIEEVIEAFLLEDEVEEA
ncbi:MAG: DUF1292 domain-containing protein [Bacilli bacterium]